MSNGGVLVTGGSGGIGAATALAFAKAGYDVAVQYRENSAGAQSVANEIAALGRRGAAIRADIADEEQTAELIEQARVCVGELCVLVNCAGIADIRLFTDITRQTWDKMITTDLTGTFNCCHAITPVFLRNGGGCIVNVSSVWGIYGASCEVHYSAAKAGVIGLTQALSKELGPSGIRVNCVAPGFIDTPMNACFDEDARADVIDRTPLCRLGTPEDVANAILFLASPEASFITGVTLPVTGGFM